MAKSERGEVLISTERVRRVTGGEAWLDESRQGINLSESDKGLCLTVCVSLSLSHDKHQQQLYLAGSDDEAVLVLVFQVFGVFQLFPSDAHCHRAQFIVCPKVVRVLW